MFTCNSGSANVYVTNIIDGVIYRDIANTWMNVDAPVGSVSKKTFIHNKSSYIEFTSSGIINTLCNRTVNLHIVGGGGGGAGGFWWRDDGTNLVKNGGGGGSGFMNNWLGITLNAGKYNFQAGAGGAGGQTNWWTSSNPNFNSATDGGAGGTSYIVGTDFYAIGGNGGNGWGPGQYESRNNANVSLGGLGNGGYMGWAILEEMGGMYFTQWITAENSPVSFAGGGGGMGNANGSGWAINGRGGWPYGGHSGYYHEGNSSYISATSGTRGGGGGGAIGSRGGRAQVGNGGMGLIRINIIK